MRFSLITFHFGEERIRHMQVLLESWQAFAASADLEFILVELGSKHFEGSQNITYVQLGQEALYRRSHCLNAGAQIARGDYLVFHDSDIPLPPKFFDVLQREVDEGRDYFASYQEMRHLMESVTESVFQDPKRAECGYHFVDTSPTHIRQHGVRGMAGGSTTVQRTLFQRAGCFHEGMLGWGGEDRELDARLRYLNGNQVGVAKQVLLHLHHEPCDPKKDNPNLKKNYQILLQTLLHPQRTIDELVKSDAH